MYNITFTSINTTIMIHKKLLIYIKKPGKSNHFMIRIPGFNMNLLSFCYIFTYLSTSTTNTIAPPASTSTGYGTYNPIEATTGEGSASIFFLVLHL